MNIKEIDYFNLSEKTNSNEKYYLHFRAIIFRYCFVVLGNICNLQMIS